MKVRPGILFSSAAHAALLVYAIVGLSAAKPFDVGPTEALPIEILTPQEFDAMTKGSRTSKKVDAPKVKADKVAAAEPEPVDDDTPEAKEDVKAPPPPAAAEPPPPPKLDPKVEQAKAEAAKAAEAAKVAEAAKAEKAAQEKVVAEKAAKAAADKVAVEKAQAAEGERLAKVEAEKVAAEKAAAEKAAKAEADKLAKAEAEKAAKEKAEKLAKLEAEKAAKAEAEKAAKEKAEKLAKLEAEKKAAERKFDPSKIASLLDKPSKSSSETAMKDVRDPGRKAVAARETAPETTAGTSRGTAAKLSMSERTGIDNAVREQIMQCWNPPVGAADDGSLAVKVQFTLNADGSLSGGPTVTNSSSNPSFRAAAGAATRAVQRCAPLKLPAEAYDYWRQVNINFDPKELMGG